ncbi:MAG: gliding motility-associated C-terminal domain-containing protein [Runella slithyformis]|nr:MAG: gliding motility-associated C-terminal domain-containing protein [Runella slithyformis]
MQVSNLGSNDLIEVQLIDSLDKTFKNGAVIVGKPLVKVFDSAGMTITEGWATDTTFTGKGADNNLTVAEITGLKAGQSRVVLMTVQIDVANAQDSIFYNTAYVAALDIDGNLCRDVSSDGLVADLDGDGDPANDSTPTAITLQSFRKDTDLFVPEGFSPNGDGINDVLVIQKAPALRVSIEIYNRWGGLVYRSDDYKNDWNGTVANKTNSSIPVGTYFSVIKTSDGRELSKFLTVNR